MGVRQVPPFLLTDCSCGRLVRLRPDEIRDNPGHGIGFRFLVPAFHGQETLSARCVIDENDSMLHTSLVPVPA